MSDDKLTLEQVQQTYGQLLSAKELLYDWYGGNVYLFKFINGFHTPDYDLFMYYVTQLGNKYFILYYLAGLGILAVLSTIYRKLFRKGGVKQHIFMWIGALAVLGASFAVYAAVTYWLKDYFAYPRPYVVLEGVIQIEAKGPSDAYRSLPSGHVAFISLIVFSLWSLLSHNMRLFALGLILLVAWSRIVMGVHFPADTLWGCLLGLTIVLGVRVVVNKFLSIFGIHCAA